MTTVAFILVSWRPDAPAGMERSVASAAGGLTAMGHQAVIITAERSAPNSYFGTPIIQLSTLVIPSPCDDRTLRDAIERADPALASELRDIYAQHHVDVAICVDALWGLGRWMPVEDQTKRVLAVHVVGHEIDLSPALARAQTVIVPSTVVARQASERGFDTRAWQVVPNALLADAEPPPPATRRRLRDHGPIRVLARLGPEKGVHDLLAAAAHLRPTRRAEAALATAGFEAAPGSQQELLRLCHRLGEQSGILIQPGMPWRDVPGWLAAASVVIVPSHAETFGLVALEAMAVGTPVVCFDVGNLPGLVGDGGVVVPSGDGPAALWRGAQTLLADGIAYERISRDGYCQTQDYQPRYVTDLLLRAVS